MGTKSFKWVAAVFVGVLVLITVVLLIPTDEPKEKPAPAPSLTVSAEPSPSVAPSAHAVVDPLRWDVVEDLELVTGDWRVRKGHDGTGTLLRVTRNNKTSLYPFSLRYEPSSEDKRPLECGFYSRLEDGWRLGYCSGYTQATPGVEPNRMGFHVAHSDAGQPKYLRVQVGNILELYLERRP